MGDEIAKYPGESQLSSQDRSQMWLRALMDLPKNLINVPASLIAVLWQGFVKHEEASRRK